jgi:2'-5' RNA ligase
MSATNSAKRLFIAVMLPPEVQERVAALVDLLEEHRAILRPARPESLHFTLRFLGDVTLDEERRASDACAAAVMGVQAFPLVIGGAGVFPNARRPRVIWLRVRDGTANLMALQRRVEEELLRLEVITSRERFTPHLTLARVRVDAAPSARAALGADVARLTDKEQARLTVTGVSLVHSVLTPQGSTYMALHTAALAPHE